MVCLLFVLFLFIEQEPLTEQEIEDLVAEFLEVESKVSYYSLSFKDLCSQCFVIVVLIYSFYSDRILTNKLTLPGILSHHNHGESSLGCVLYHCISLNELGFSAAMEFKELDINVQKNCRAFEFRRCS